MRQTPRTSKSKHDELMQPPLSPQPKATATGRRDLRLIAGLITAGAAVALAIGFWDALCQFPVIPWNDLRLAPAIAMAKGIRVFGTAEGGVVNTWMYGPLPLFWYAPAAWGGSAGAALIIAGALNIALTLIPIALVCLLWPAGEAAEDSRSKRALAWLLCLALWPPMYYHTLFADNLAIACGLIGNLLLVRARGSRALWAAAAVATLAMACKQIAVAAPLAQVLWMGITGGGRAALWHAVRCAVAGAIIGALAIAFFGAENLWFTLVEVPGQVQWMPTFAHVQPALIEAAWQVLPPAALMAWKWRAFRRPALLLPALAWACALPLGIMALCKAGGWVNSLHSLVLWLPAVATTLLTSRPPERFRPLAPLAIATVAAAMACVRITQSPTLAVRPQTALYDQAANIVAKYPGQIWFPLSPMVTLYSDGQYYHDEDGMFVRQLGRKAMPGEQIAAHVPPRLRALAYRSDWNNWGIARRYLPPNPREVVAGDWTLWVAVLEGTERK